MASTLLIHLKRLGTSRYARRVAPAFQLPGPSEHWYPPGKFGAGAAIFAIGCHSASYSCPVLWLGAHSGVATALAIAAQCRGLGLTQGWGPEGIRMYLFFGMGC